MATETREHYLISLLSETLPAHLINDQLLKEMAIDDDEYFGIVQVLFSNTLQRSIETQEPLVVADWKSALHQEFLSPFKAPFVKSIYFLNLAPFTRTLIFSLPKADQGLVEGHIKAWFDQICHLLEANDWGSIMAFSSREMTRFEEMGKLYKDLRQLNDYRFILGMGSLTFKEDWRVLDSYSLTEYKYIKEYENLLNQEQWEELFPLITTLYQYLRNHVIKDGKLIYVYKELISITIRHLYSNETAHLENIERLNRIIIDFDHEFDDLEDVHHFMQDLVHMLRSHNHDLKQQHPHIKKALKMIHRRFNEPLTLTDVAEELSLSSAYVSRLFKSEIQLSFKEYLTKYRLDQVKELLVTSDLPISKIAQQCGYLDPNQLTRIFKKYEKTTPRAYRQRDGDV